jgi:ankyrin repeat protein
MRTGKASLWGAALAMATFSAPTQAVVSAALDSVQLGAAAADCELCVRMLLEQGADAKGATCSGITPLHYAVYTGNDAPSVI